MVSDSVNQMKAIQKCMLETSHTESNSVSRLSLQRYVIYLTKIKSSTITTEKKIHYMLYYVSE